MCRDQPWDLGMTSNTTFIPDINRRKCEQIIPIDKYINSLRREILTTNWFCHKSLVAPAQTNNLLCPNFDYFFGNNFEKGLKSYTII